MPLRRLSRLTSSPWVFISVCFIVLKFTGGTAGFDVLLLPPCGRREGVLRGLATADTMPETAYDQRA